MGSHIQTKQKTDSQEYPFCRPFIFKGDPVGIRTRDPQLRRLLLYPAELPDLVGMRSQEETRSTSLACRDSSSYLKLTKFGVIFAVFDRLEDSFLNAYARKTTYAGTAISAYKGNLGAKVLLFFELCK